MSSPDTPREEQVRMDEKVRRAVDALDTLAYLVCIGKRPHELYAEIRDFLTSLPPSRPAEPTSGTVTLSEWFTVSVDGGSAHVAYPTRAHAEREAQEAVDNGALVVTIEPLVHYTPVLEAPEGAVAIIASEISDAIAAHDAGENVNAIERAGHVARAIAHALPPSDAPSGDDFRCRHCDLPIKAHSDARIRECTDAIAARMASPPPDAGRLAEVEAAIDRYWNAVQDYGRFVPDGMEKVNAARAALLALYGVPASSGAREGTRAGETK